ncbi:MAG TPA: DUF2007 domain-containing protein [Flavobacteriaceae bacterium]|nr:DUF2007 domain-containing protein [Flavobacteriaceae bacterium]
MKKFISIARFTYTHEYAVLKLLLENENIEFFFQNEQSNGILPYHSGIVLNVNAKQETEAREILNRFRLRVLKKE